MPSFFEIGPVTCMVLPPKVLNRRKSQENAEIQWTIKDLQTDGQNFHLNLVPGELNFHLDINVLIYCNQKL